MKIPGVFRLLALMLIVGGCRQDSYSSRNFFEKSNCDYERGRYFPVSGVMIFIDSYIKSLQVMGEAPLCDSRGKIQTYRFLWLRAFHGAVSIRILETVDGADLFIRVLDATTFDQPPKLAKRFQRKVSKAVWMEFLQELQTARFGSAPGFDERLNIATGWDGAQWVLEGVRDFRYTIDDRWSPRKDGRDAAFRAACLFLLELSELQIPPEELY